MADLSNPHADLAEVPVQRVLDLYAERLKEADRKGIMSEAQIEHLTALVIDLRDETNALRAQIATLEGEAESPPNP